MVLVATVGVAACSLTGADQRGHPTDLVTRTSLGGIHLQDSQTMVQRIYGPGRNVHRHGERVFHYPAGLTVYYDPSATASRVALVEATSVRFHTASGAHIGGSFRAVRSLGHMDCGPITDTRVECLTHADGPGLQFDIVGGKVVFLALVLRTK
jgi:hypothetical protein